MGFQAAKCAQCGGALQVPDDRDIVKCMYCGVDVIVREAVHLQISQGNPKHYLTLGQVAADSGNHAEAYKYFSMVLEVEPTNSDAWQKKGTSAGWQSNLSSLRFTEMITCHQKALEFATNEGEAEVIKMMSAMEQLLIAKAVFELSTQHTIQFIGAPNAKFEHVDRCKEVIRLCEHSASLYGEDLNAARLIVEIASRFKSLGGLSSDERSYFDSKRAKYQSQIEPVAHNTSQPTGDASGCFVITATMGDQNHPHVHTLRTFREQILAKTSLGKRFIQWYATNGPGVAKLIAASPFARVLSYFLIVIPCALTARATLRLIHALGARQSP